MLFTKPAPVILAAIATLSLFTGACATKKHVREAIAPVQNQINDVSKKTDQNTTSIGDLDRTVAKVDEKAMEADRKAGVAGEAARTAGQAADKAQQSANGAQQLAQQSMTKAESVDASLQNVVSNLDNYKLATTEKVYFRVSRAELTDEEKAKLDQAVQAVATAKNYAIEVEGFTDHTGSKSLNLDLSRRRADAVVRYLTVEKSIPLRKIHDVGVGADFPNAVNKTREDRKENRRVEVKIFTLDGMGTSTKLQSSATTPSR